MFDQKIILWVVFVVKANTGSPRPMWQTQVIFTGYLWKSSKLSSFSSL